MDANNDIVGPYRRRKGFREGNYGEWVWSFAAPEGAIRARICGHDEVGNGMLFCGVDVE